MLKRVIALTVLCVAAGLLYDWLTLPRYDGPSSDHFDGRVFISPGYAKKTTRDILGWMASRQPGPWQSRANAAANLPPARVDQGLRITFINHSTALIQLQGINILTDPVWSDRTGPFGKIGPSRYRQPGLALDQLPAIDVVVISHSHYDHMDLPTLSRLHRQFDPVFVAGLGNRDNLAKVNIDKVVELDWWQTHKMDNGIGVTATPAEHWSRRTILDTNRTLWTGFSITHDDRHRVYFAGDTGYGPHFATVQDQLGAPDVALLPIGAYLPRWFMEDNHISPVEALEAARDLNAGVMIPIHFGTFALGDDGQDEPLRDLLQAKPAYGDVSIRVLENGKSDFFPGPN